MGAEGHCHVEQHGHAVAPLKRDGERVVHRQDALEFPEGAQHRTIQGRPQREIRQADHDGGVAHEGNAHVGQRSDLHAEPKAAPPGSRSSTSSSFRSGSSPR